MRPPDLRTRIFLDSGNPAETKLIKVLMGFLDGQTTNPTLISKHPLVQEKIHSGELFTAEEALGLYKRVVQEISETIPDGAVSIEVYADETTTKNEMLDQADELNTWIPHPHIKFPITHAGLEAAQQAVVDGMNVNMTLCFSQVQAAAVYAATRGAKPGQVFLSPFVGRLDDIGYDGVAVIENIVRMFQDSDQHVQVLAASIRSLDHLIRSFQYGADFVTAPYHILKEWTEAGFPVQTTASSDNETQLKPVEYQTLDLNKHWQTFHIDHELTKNGLLKFVDDWNALIQK